MFSISRLLYMQTKSSFDDTSATLTLVTYDTCWHKMFFCMQSRNLNLLVFSSPFGSKVSQSISQYLKSLEWEPYRHSTWLPSPLLVPSGLSLHYFYRKDALILLFLMKDCTPVGLVKRFHKFFFPRMYWLKSPTVYHCHENTSLTVQ